ERAQARHAPTLAGLAGSSLVATAAQWVEGARPRTLPAAVAPVLAGTAVAVDEGQPDLGKAALALVVSLALQVGVNYANDYSDGIRGTDRDRVGPLRLVGSGVAAPSQVRAAAGLSFLLAALAGGWLAATTAWWLLLVGALAGAAAWFYTGGSHPYGYAGLGEVSVFVFFGLVAVVGTTYVQAQRVVEGAGWLAAGIGALACAILVANNLRDVVTDEVAGKRTLAVVVGEDRTRSLFTALHASAYVCLGAVGVSVTWWALLGLVSVPLSLRAAKVVRRGATGSALVVVLRDTGLAQLSYAAGIFTGLLVTTLR
ncbi:MAG TPA: 1,4-dihydroxy-2-naphthoate polyprenyltransferase, partial [Pseudonocardiaceae bacterium]|nr:1,4-dihydroxy-2-naphthoate polyprenyltransferase [Pseudonocardiaceae bacterium]